MKPEQASSINPRTQQDEGASLALLYLIASENDGRLGVIADGIHVPQDRAPIHHTAGGDDDISFLGHVPPSLRVDHPERIKGFL